MNRWRHGLPLTLALLAIAQAAPPAQLHAATLFALVDTGELFTSVDQGTSWSIRATLPVRDAVGLAAGATPTDLFLATRSGVVYRTMDGGYVWSAVGAVPADDVVDVALRSNLTLLLLTATGTLYRSTDNGITFTALAALTGSDFVSFARAPQDRLYALARTGAVSQSVDGGTTWNVVGTITTSHAVRLRALGNALHAMTGSGDIYRSTDQAVTWTPIGTLSQVGMTAMTNDEDDLIVSSAGGEVASSADGAAWLWKGTINQLTVASLGVDLPATTSVPSQIAGAALELARPWPNPIAPGVPVSLALTLPSEEVVTVEVHDIAGRHVARRAPESQAAGPVMLRWNPGLLQAGLHFVHITTGSGKRAVARLVVLR